MNFAQIGIVAAFFAWGQILFGMIMLGVLVAQFPLQYRFVDKPLKNYLIFSAFGVLIFVIGMLIAAIGLGAQ